MDTNGSSPDRRTVATRRAKQGARDYWPGSYLSIAVSLMRKQLVQLDHLAVEIRAAQGNWITRSGIIAAIVEAALQTTPVSESGAAVQDERGDKG